MRKFSPLSKYFLLGIFVLFYTNAIGQNHVDSDNRIIWNHSENINYSFNVTGIGRDDASSQNIKQTTSHTDNITIGIKEIASTNSNNENIFFADKTFLMWGHNNEPSNAIATDIVKDLGNGTSTTTLVSTTPIKRVWKMVVTDSVPTVKISIPEAMVSATNSGNDNYIMLVSDDDTFTTNVTSSTMKKIGNKLQTNFYFEDTKYITFGSTTTTSNISRSASFNGNDMYLDAGNVNSLINIDFTISAWVKRNSEQGNFDIISKRNFYIGNTNYTNGYSLNIDSDNKITMEWKNTENTTNNAIKSSSSLPENEWHHIAVTYNFSSNNAKLYIDGYLENSSYLPPISTPSEAHFIIGAAHHIKRQQNFNGSIDEVRLWSVQLTKEQIHYIMNQEITNNSSLVDGKVIPTTVTKNEISTIAWDKLIAYYPMNSFIFSSVKDESNYGNDASMINYNYINKQTAPLPYQTSKNGDWDNANTWVNGHVQYLPGTVSFNSEETINNNIIRINHDVTLNNSNSILIPENNNDNRTVLGLLINNGKLQIDGDTEKNTGYSLTVSHYLKLNGAIDLEGESQLIQTDNSVFDSASTGYLERDQQGTPSTYTFNHWSSPVAQNSNSNYTLNNVITNVGFLTSGYNGTSSPLKNADYWIWKYANNTQTNQCQWLHTRSTGTILPGEGFTMKGPGTPALNQNYIFRGVPNNGDINLTISLNNDYLIGNPYPSSIDANAFIKDNLSVTNGGNNASGNIINGTLYFWDHFALNSHTSGEYQGGYATYTLLGGVLPINNDVRINSNSEVKLPERYIPIGKGFYVSAKNNDEDSNISGGDIIFKNTQRIFKKEQPLENNNNNIEDIRQKIKIMFHSPDGYHRQLLLGVDENSTNNFDLGYDGLLIEDNKEDLFWTLENLKLTIQAVNNFSNTQVLPLGAKINKAGIATFKIDKLFNIDSDLDIILHDKDLNIYHNLRESNYETSISTGEHLERFELLFSLNSTSSSLSNKNEFTIDNFQIFYSNEKKGIIILNPNQKSIDSIKIHSVLGSVLLNLENLNNNLEYQEYKIPEISSGTYILSLKNESKSLSKKVLIK